MRAVKFIGPSKVVLVDDAPKPQPGEGEVLVQIRYVALCGTNMGPYLGEGHWANLVDKSPPGWLGHENIGTIIESRAVGWEPGTLVLAHPEDYNGFAEFVRSKAKGLARLPANPPDLPTLIVAQPLATVLRALARTGPVINQRCAILGQGPMGLIFSQVLGRMGARQIIAIDKVAWRLPWATRFGATDVVDASKEDPVEAVKRLTGGAMADFVVEAVGQPHTVCTSVRLARRFGRLFVFGIPHYDVQEFPWFQAVMSELEILTSNGPECMEYFQTAVDMITRGHVDLSAMVTPRLPWEKAPQAFDMYANPDRSEDSLKITLVF
jgi:L-iditol 2-dehydrogenase